MKRSKIKRQNIFQLFLAIVIIILISYIAGFVHARFDLTSEKRYTLSPATLQLLKELDDRVYIKIYLAGDDLPYGFKRLQRAATEMLDEFKIYADDKIEYEIVNPFESKDPKKQQGTIKELVDKGLKPLELKERTAEGKQSQKIIFPGAVAIYQGKEMAVNFVKNNRNLSAEANLNNSIQALEYEFVNVVKKLQKDKFDKIAFIEGHGELSEVQTVEATKALFEYYDIVVGKMGGKLGILDSFAAVIIAKPTQKFSEQDLFVLDQYIMQGGKVLWLVDGVSASMDSAIYADATIAMVNPVVMPEQLGNLLFTYGVRITPTVIKDLQCAMAAGNRLPFCPVLSSSNNHPVNKYLDVIITEFISQVDTLGNSPDIEKTVILKSSQNSKKHNINVGFRIDRKMATGIIDETTYTSSFPVGVLLEGKFKSYFKDQDYKPFVKKAGDKFAAKSIDTRMIVIGDGDVIRNEVRVTPSGEVKTLPLGFNKFTQKVYPGNKNLILNAVNYLCADADLMSLRSRELKLRLLDKKQIREEKLIWQVINTLVPVLIIILFGLIANWWRKQRYSAH